MALLIWTIVCAFSVVWLSLKPKFAATWARIDLVYYPCAILGVFLLFASSDVDRQIASTQFDIISTQQSLNQVIEAQTENVSEEPENFFLNLNSLLAIISEIAIAGYEGAVRKGFHSDIDINSLSVIDHEEFVRDFEIPILAAFYRVFSILENTDVQYDFTSDEVPKWLCQQLETVSLPKLKWYDNDPDTIGDDLPFGLGDFADQTDFHRYFFTRPFSPINPWDYREYSRCVGGGNCSAPTANLVSPKWLGFPLGLTANEKNTTFSKFKQRIVWRSGGSEGGRYFQTTFHRFVGPLHRGSENILILPAMEHMSVVAGHTMKAGCDKGFDNIFKDQFSQALPNHANRLELEERLMSLRGQLESHSNNVYRTDDQITSTSRTILLSTWPYVLILALLLKIGKAISADRYFDRFRRQ